MRRKLLISGAILTLTIIFSVIFIINKNNTNNEIVMQDNNKNLINNSFLTLMLETEAGSGIYQQSTSSTWPGEGYVFNGNLSSCENGGELSWNEELGAVNLKSNLSDRCYLYFDAYIIPVINSVATSNITQNSITLTVNATNGNNPITTYYYSSNNGSNYVESTSNTYTFNNLEMSTEYNFSIYVEDSAGYKSEVYTLRETTEDIILLADWVIEQYGGKQGNNGIYYHEASLANSAEDNSYRYAGANPNNYVCFGSDAATCPSNNLYRIIGVFENEVKLIKSTSYGNYTWDSRNSNTWSTSTIKSTLNTTFLNMLDSTWQNKIKNHSWIVNGTNRNDNFKASDYYNYEVSNKTLTDDAKVGLMYVSDFGFAIDKNYWNRSIYNYNGFANLNWLAGITEWTITRRSDTNNYAFSIDARGFIGDNVVNRSSAIRPCFYLTSDTQYSSGSGTSSDPIRLSVQ